MIEYAVRKHFPDLPDTTGPQTYARNYLEKLIQVPFRIPALGDTETRIYVTLLLVGAELGENDPAFNSLIAVARERLKRPWTSGALDASTVRTALKDKASRANNALALSDQIGPILASGTKGNPRQIKRFLNSLVLRQRTAEARGFGADVKLPVLAKLMLAERFLPRLFDQIAAAAAAACLAVSATARVINGHRSLPTGRKQQLARALLARLIHVVTNRRSPRVHEALRREGVRCSNKRVARLMRERGLRARVSRLYRKGSGMVRRFFAKTGNLRLEEPLPTRIDQIWVGDLTYLRLGKRWRYLATVMDLFSRRIVGWTLSRHRTVEVTLRALKRAIRARNPQPGLLFHSDRGIEYSGYGYQDFLQAKGIVPSMNRPRHCQDNAHMESFFHSLKAELTCQRNYASDAELNASIAGYIDRFYNKKRIHSSLGYHSPVEFECLANA